jgi:hypothetical protein
MAEFLASASQWLDALFNRLGIHAFRGLEGVYCVLGLTLFLVFCANAYSAIRVAFSRGYSRR